MRPLLELQAAGRRCPADREWLVERISARDGHSSSSIRSKAASRTSDSPRCSLTAFARDAATFSLIVNDYGFGLLSPMPVTLSLGELGRLLAAPTSNRHPRRVQRRRARPPAVPRDRSRRRPHVPGLPRRAHPTANCRRRGLLYEVFAEYDPGQPLLVQAVREVLERQLEAPRLAAALARLRGAAPGHEARAPDTVRLPAAGRDVPREADHRGARGACRADGRSARSGSGRRLRHPAPRTADTRLPLSS